MKALGSPAVVVKLIDGTIVKGRINIRAKTRLSDFFKETDEQFLIIFDVFTPETSEEVIFINKNHVLWAMPLEGE